MDNLSTASTDISSQVGALELGDNLESHGDDMLEIAGAGLQDPTQPMGVQRCVSDDGALLSAADTAVSNPPTAFSGGSGRCF